MAALPQPSKKYVGTGFAPSVKAAFLMAGYLNKEKSSDLAALLGAWNKRYFTFDGKVLNYFQDEDTAFMGPSGSTFLRDIKGIKLCPEMPGHVFQVFTTKRSFKLQAFSENDRNKWMIALQNVLSARDREADLQENEMKVAKEVFAKFNLEDDVTAKGDCDVETEIPTPGNTDVVPISAGVAVKRKKKLPVMDVVDNEIHESESGVLPVKNKGMKKSHSAVTTVLTVSDDNLDVSETVELVDVPKKKISKRIPIHAEVSQEPEIEAVPIVITKKKKKSTRLPIADSTEDQDEVKQSAAEFDLCAPENSETPHDDLEHIPFAGKPIAKKLKKNSVAVLPDSLDVVSEETKDDLVGKVKSTKKKSSKKQSSLPAVSTDFMDFLGAD